jgi:transcriptional regulator with XRE-family HTH domain
MTWSPKLFVDVGAAALRLREEQGLTYEELEKKSGVSVSTIRRLEKGEPVMLDNLDKILVALGVENWLEFVGQLSRMARERRQGRAYPQHYLAEGPALLGADTPPLHVRLQLGDREALLTLTIADLATLRRDQPELPWTPRQE